jgi:hypothetical protein
LCLNIVNITIIINIMNLTIIINDYFFKRVLGLFSGIFVLVQHNKVASAANSF